MNWTNYASKSNWVYHFPPPPLIGNPYNVYVNREVFLTIPTYSEKIWKFRHPSTDFDHRPGPISKGWIFFIIQLPNLSIFRLTKTADSGGGYPPTAPTNFFTEKIASALKTTHFLLSEKGPCHRCFEHHATNQTSGFTTNCWWKKFDSVLDMKNMYPQIACSIVIEVDEFSFWECPLLFPRHESNPKSTPTSFV